MSQTRISILVVAGLLGCAKREAPPVAAKVAPPASPMHAAGTPAAALPATRASGPSAAHTEFRSYAIMDRQQGLVMGTLAVPRTWTATSEVTWKYADVSVPVHMAARVSAPDGSAWLEAFPSELFYWLVPRDPTPVGAKSLGMIHSPGIGVKEALTRYVINRYRRKPGLQILGFRPIPNLAAALGKPAFPGDSLAARVRYVEGGRTVDEEFFAILGQTVRIPYHGPQGTTYEFHRVLTYVHSMGATDGQLDRVAPQLGFVVSSFRFNPAWETRQQQVTQRLSAQFNQYLAQGYAQIAAAAQLSRTISANNDAMLQGMDAQRVTANQRFEAQRQADSTVDQGSSDAFDQYIRGTEKMQDPYWGTSEQDYTTKYHWTDGAGNYQHSNDASFNPNVGANVNWQLMKAEK